VWYKSRWAAQVLGYLANTTPLWDETRILHKKLLDIILVDTRNPAPRSTWMITELLLHLEPYITKLAQQSSQISSFSLNGKTYQLGTGKRGRDMTITIPWTTT
jgi:hypothetical protein